jgi:hypothetical protein
VGGCLHDMYNIRRIVNKLKRNWKYRNENFGIDTEIEGLLNKGKHAASKFRTFAL